MKITETHRTVLAEAIAPLDLEEYRVKYRAGDIARFDSVKDINKRYRWDLYWFAVRIRNHAILSGEYDIEPSAIPDSTNGYNMDHIDTALRSIVPAL
jgi:hypothetical protein